MPSTGFTTGPFSLTEKGINDAVSKVSAGAYALGTTQNNTFLVSYVGRSDTNLNKRLKDWVGHYSQFKGEYHETPTAAFVKECFLYHEFGGAAKLDNKVHPARPDNSGWKCPHCKVFG